METGCLALVLHAHLPFVRHPEHEYSLEENWLYQAITETYVPLLLMMDGLVEDGIDFRLTFSLTPTLASMLGDALLQKRYRKRLDRLIELAGKEIARTRALPEFNRLARMYHKLFQRVRKAFAGRYRGDLVSAFRRLQDLGKIEILASAATHGYLPLLSVRESAVRAQVRLGIEHYRRAFHRGPRGFWLPECGFYSGVDRILREHGADFTILESHGVTRAIPRPRYGVHAPVACESGLAAFGRDPDSSRQVWSSVEGYPGDFDYREFYRDIGYDLDLGYILPYIHPDGIRIDTGIKYHRVTGKDVPKEPYVPERAELKAEMHAGHFLGERIRQVEDLAPLMDRKPLVLAPYDAELFGHWWFEGPRWLDQVIRKAARQDTIRLVTLSEYLDEYPVQDRAEPSPSSWGQRGFSEVWLNPQNHWIYPHLDSAARAMEELASARADARGLTRRALDQAARELLLAQASDWAFMINYGTTGEYATRRIKSHLLRLERLRGQIESGAIDRGWLAQLESQDNIFTGIDVGADFARPLAPLHIAMAAYSLCPALSGLAVGLERLGHRVSIVLPDSAAPAAKIGIDTPVHLGHYVVFCRSVLERLRRAEPPAILHAHGWQSALAIAFLEAQPWSYPELQRVRTVLTVEDAADQGVFEADQWPLLDLGQEFFTPRYLEYFGKINLLKAGLVFADAITTAGASRARELQTAAKGHGLEGVFRQRAARLVGIPAGDAAGRYVALYRQVME